VPQHVVTINPEHCPGGSAVLEIDIGRAWEEMELDSGWNNEVGVDVFLH